MPPSADEYRAGVLALQQQQRASLTSLIEQVDGSLAYDWQRGMGAAAKLYGPILDQYAKDLAALRAAEDDPAARLTLNWLTNRNPQLATISESVAASAEKYGQTAAQTVTQAQAAASEMAASDAAQLTQRSLWPAVEGAGVPPSVLFNRPNPDAIAQWVGRAGNGHPLGDLFGNFGAEATQGARQAMMLGLLTGANPKAMASGIANALGVSRSRATIISRTEVLGSYRSAAHETYRANSDVLNGWMWSAGGANPCAMCMGMDGLIFSLEEELIDHPCGKCAPLPVTKPWGDILGPLGIDTSDMEETSMGAPGAYETGPEKFARMSPEQQRAIIGTKTGYEAYARGEVELKDFIGTRPAEGGFPAMPYQKSLKEMEIPTGRANSRLVEPNPRLTGSYRANLRGFPIPPDEMPAWARESPASQAVYQIMRNGLPYNMSAHEIPLLETNLEQMLREDLPLNVRLAALREQDVLQQYDAYLERYVNHVTTGASTLGPPPPFEYKASKELERALAAARAGERGAVEAAEDIGRAYAPARATVSDAEAAARAEVKAARSQVNSLNRKLSKALETSKPTTTLEADIAKAKNVLEQAQAKLDAQVAIRKEAEAAVKAAAKAQAAAERAVAREAAKAVKAAERQAAKEAAAAQKAADREAAKAAKLAEKQAIKEAASTAKTAKGEAASIEEQATTTERLSTDQLKQLVTDKKVFTDPNTGRTDFWTSESENGQRYIIRPADGPNSPTVLMNELADRVGLSDYYLSAQTVESDGQWYEVQRMLEGKQADEAIDAAKLSTNAYMSEDERMKVSLFANLVGDDDRFANNMWITPDDKLVQIDYNMLFSPDPVGPGGELLRPTNHGEDYEVMIKALGALKPSPEVRAWMQDVLLSPDTKQAIMQAVLKYSSPYAEEHAMMVGAEQVRLAAFERYAALKGTPNLSKLFTYIENAELPELSPADVAALATKYDIDTTASNAAFAASRAGSGIIQETANYDLTAADKQFVAQLKQQVDALDQSALTHDHAIDIGGQIHDRIMSDPVVADLHDWAAEAQALMSSPAGTLTDAQMAWLRAEPDALAAHGGVRVGLAQAQYQAEYQARVLTYLQEMREMGGAEVQIDETAAGYDIRVAKAVSDVSDRIPRDWIEASNNLGDLNVIKNRATNSAGWYRPQITTGADGLPISNNIAELAISYNRQTAADDIGIESNALHEMMHRMENAIPRLGQLERDYYNARTAGEAFVDLENGIAGKTKLDEWLDPYLGREPLGQFRPEYPHPEFGFPVKTSTSYELLSMGIEALLGGVSDMAYLREDEEYMHFILGLLSIVRAEAPGVVLP